MHQQCNSRTLHQPANISCRWGGGRGSCEAWMSQSHALALGAPGIPKLGTLGHCRDIVRLGRKDPCLCTAGKDTPRFGTCRDSLRLGTAETSQNACDGHRRYTLRVGQCRDSLLLGTCSWALHGYSAVRRAVGNCGTAGILCSWAELRYSASGHAGIFGGYALCDVALHGGRGEHGPSWTSQNKATPL